MRDMRIVIIDDNFERRELVKNYLPDYVEGITCGYGDAAISALARDKNGNVPDMILMNADDKKGLSLYTFDWIKTKAVDELIAMIPVVLFTEDEFSDRCLDFLEIDDVTFYEGEIEEDRLYSTIMTVIANNDFAVEPVERSFSDEKSFDRILGLSVKPIGETIDNKRSVVLDMDSQMDNLQAALQRGREKTERIKELLEAASEYKGQMKNEQQKRGFGAVGFLNKIQEEKELEKTKPIFKADGNVDPLLAGLDMSDVDDIPDEFKLASEKVSVEAETKREFVKSMQTLNQKMLNNPAQAIGAQIRSQQTQTPADKKRIVIVDDTEADRKLCEIYLSSKYEVILLESGMRAIDYFINNTADLMLLDTYMPNLGGVQTLASIRWQKNGKDVPVIYLTDRRFPVSQQSLVGEKVIGVLQKPLTAGGLAVAIDGLFRRMGK